MTQKNRHSGRSGSVSEVQRLDKWLWFTRVVKSRTLAAALIGSGKVRVNRERVTKASHSLKLGDVVTAMVAKKVRVLKVLAVGHRRGPASEAQSLYEDLTPELVTGSGFVSKTGSARVVGGQRARVFGALGSGVAFAREPGAGRPTKRDRRKIDRLKNDER